MRRVAARAAGHDTTARSTASGSAPPPTARSVTSIGVTAPLVDVPMTAAGGLYSSATDLARFLGFQIQGGSIAGRAILDPSLARRDADDPRAARRGAGRLRARRRPDPMAGGGLPGPLLARRRRVRLPLRPVVRAEHRHRHRDPDELGRPPAAGRPRDLDHARLRRRAGERLRPATRRAAVAVRVPGRRRRASSPRPTSTSLVAAAAMPPTGDQAARWAAYTGDYRIPSWGSSTRLRRPSGSSSRPASRTSRPPRRGRSSAIALRRSSPASSWPTTARRSTCGRRWRPGETSTSSRPRAGPLPWQAGIMALAAITAAGLVGRDGRAYRATPASPRERLPTPGGAGPARPVTLRRDG